MVDFDAEGFLKEWNILVQSAIDDVHGKNEFPVSFPVLWADKLIRIQRERLTDYSHKLEIMESQLSRANRKLSERKDV